MYDSVISIGPKVRANPLERKHGIKKVILRDLALGHDEKYFSGWALEKESDFPWFCDEVYEDPEFNWEQTNNYLIVVFGLKRRLAGLLKYVKFILLRYPGSALLSQTLEPAQKQLVNLHVDSLVDINKEFLNEIVVSISKDLLGISLDEAPQPNNIYCPEPIIR